MDFDDILDSVMEAPANTWESITGIFENIGEFSITGVIFGALCAGLIFLLSNWTMKPFIEHMSWIGGITITILTYIVCFIGGYLLGVHFENS
jgi:MFS superfamily sulfate permease-like transporter